jgi:sugar O-acyltransferase (sialic acid O-acetyltransferase NeuD family)
MNSPALIIIGAGRHGRIVAEVARATGRFASIGFADDNMPVGTTLDGIPVLGPWAATDGGAYVVAIGDNGRRSTIYEELKRAGKSVATLVSPRAHVSSGAVVGEGTVVLAGAVLQAGSRVGVNVVVNIGVLADHDAEIGDHANVAPGCVLACFARVDARERVAPGTVRGGFAPGTH